ncbi:MAG: hypothetical protein A2096_13440 [Spirochaetes bacterium GWF1_41_5]|nr:MAG: hypothetical protein A2096_13440 [Spirochaetes bacterium GWF1_41_5]
MNNITPNILLIVADQWRGDCLGFMGHPAVQTPNLDRIFARSISFTQAYSAVPSCIAARAALLTGLSQKTHGRIGYMDGITWNYQNTLPGLLAQAGYHTHCAGKMHVHPARNLLGFHSVDLHDGYLHFERKQNKNYSLADDYLQWFREKAGFDADLTDAGVGCNGYSVHPWPYEERFHPTNWVTTKSIDFLRRRDPGKPFFLKVSYHRPHPPLDPPQSFLDQYLGMNIPDPVTAPWSEHDQLQDRGYDCPVPAAKDQITLARKAYYAQISHIDNQINRLTHALIEFGVWDNTIIVFTSDHGDMLYDHNRVAKSLPYNGSARIPLLFRIPENSGIDKAMRPQEPVELRDLLPTLLDYAGIPIPHRIEGMSLKPVIEGKISGWREYLHGEHASGVHSNHWITNGRDMYVWYSQTGKEQLFDLTADPYNRNDLFSANPERVKKWRDVLIRELSGREEGYTANGKLITGRQPWSIRPFLEKK